MITAVMIGIFLIVSSFIAAPRYKSINVRARIGFMLPVLAGAVSLIAVQAELYRNFTIRFENLVTDTFTGTVVTRLSLWSAGIKAFVNNPLTGIGPGNFRFIDLAFPELKFDAARIWVKGYSAHNLVVHYLAETGLIGTVAMISVYFHNLKSAWKVFRKSQSSLPDSLRWSLYGVGLTIAVTIFYMDGWMWGLVACAAPFFIALTSKALSGDNDHE
jgi:O-antigen ligase